jgi:hypothetical protein
METHQPPWPVLGGSIRSRAPEFDALIRHGRAEKRKLRPEAVQNPTAWPSRRGSEAAA